MLLERLVGDVEALDEVGGRDLGLGPLAAAVEQVGEESLEDAEPLGRDGAGEALRLPGLVARELVRDRRRPPGMRLRDALQRALDLGPQLRRLERSGAAFLAQDPRGEQRQAGVLGDEDAVVEPARSSVHALDPPGRVVRDFDPRLAGDVADLPVRAAAVVVDVEVLGDAEVALTSGREPDVAPHARHPELLAPSVLEVLADHVPGAVLRQQRVWVDRALALLVAVDRPVLEPDGALLRDRRLELRQPARHLGRVVGVADVDALGRLRRRRIETGAAEGEVLKREPERLGVGELALEQVEAGLQRRQLVVGQLELGEEVALGAQGVQLLARELVALRVERHTEADQLRSVGVEAPREGLVRHLGVALDVLLHVARRDRPPLGHQERHERELADQLVGVVRHEGLLCRIAVGRRQPRPPREV